MFEFVIFVFEFDAIELLREFDIVEFDVDEFDIFDVLVELLMVEEFDMFETFEVLVVDVFVIFADRFIFEFVLLAAGAPQAIPRAASESRPESAIAFFIFLLVLLSFSKTIFYLLQYTQSCPEILSYFGTNVTIEIAVAIVNSKMTKSALF